MSWRRFSWELFEFAASILLGAVCTIYAYDRAGWVLALCAAWVFAAVIYWRETR